MEIDSFGMGFIVGVVAAGGLSMGAWALAALKDTQRTLKGILSSQKPQPANADPEFPTST